MYVTLVTFLGVTFDCGICFGQSWKRKAYQSANFETRYRMHLAGKCGQAGITTSLFFGTAIALKIGLFADRWSFFTKYF